MALMVLVSVILTGLVLMISWAGAVQAQNAGMSTQRDQAQVAAESVAQVAVWKFKHDNSWRQAVAPGTLPTITIGSNNYTYALTCVDAGAAANLWWPMKEGSGSTTVDASGNGNTGTLIGGVSWTTMGRFTNGLVFDGVSGYVDAGNKPSTNITTSNTMAAWIKMNSADQDQKVGGNQDGVAGGYKMSIYGTKVEYEVRNSQNSETLNRTVSGGTILTMGIWYHVAGVYNKEQSTIKTYVNGILDRELDNVPANALGSTLGNFRMGREPWNGSNTRYFNGTINDVRVYSRALSDQEIKALADNSVQITVTTARQGTSYAYAPSGAADVVCSIPTPLPPVAPALTAGGNVPMNKETINGDLQVKGNVSGVATSKVTGVVNYGGTYSDASHYITIQGTPSTPTKVTNNVPTINYAAMQAEAVNTYTGGSNQSFSFGYLDNHVNLYYITGNVTDPLIDTSQSGGTILITGNLTLTKNASYGSNGFPAYIVVQGSVSQTGGTLTINGGLYVGTTWTHRDSTINGLVVVNGNVTDNSSNGTSITVGGIPWFDPRSATTPISQPLYYTNFGAKTP